MPGKKIININDCKDFRKFNEIGLKYTVESIVFLADHNRTMNDAIDFYGRADNIIYLIGAGLKEKTVENAMKVINDLMENGLCLEVIYCLAVMKARDNGFFINEQGLQTLDSITQSKDLLDNKTTVEVIMRVMAQYQKSMNIQENLT